jgi:hypothetical protein
LSHNQQEGQSSAEGTSSPAKSTTRSKIAGRKSAYFLGAASGAALALFAPMLRPVAKGAIKGGIKVGRQAQKVAFNIKEEFEDIATEAQAELDRDTSKPGDAA